MSNSGLHRAHENAGVTLAFYRDLADHQRGWLDLNIGSQTGKDARLPLDQIAHTRGQGRAYGAIQFADNNFGFGAEVSLVAFNKRLCCAHANSVGILAHGVFLPWVVVNPCLLRV
jgi:hypothetical protein